MGNLITYNPPFTSAPNPQPYSQHGQITWRLVNNSKQCTLLNRPSLDTSFASAQRVNGELLFGVCGGFLGKIGQNPSVSKSNQLHVGIFQLAFSFINLRKIP
jgi:hypothetical protein